MIIVGVDPGDVHVGWAEFDDGHCRLAEELTPEVAIDRLVEMSFNGRLNVFVGEEWRLYREQAMRHVGSEFPTAQMIGQIRLVLRWADRKARDEGRAPVEQVWLPASVKEPTLAVLRRRGIRSRAVATRAGGHAKDAEVLVWKFLIDQEAAKQ